MQLTTTTMHFSFMCVDVVQFDAVRWEWEHAKFQRQEGKHSHTKHVALHKEGKEVLMLQNATNMRSVVPAFIFCDHVPFFFQTFL